MNENEPDLDVLKSSPDINDPSIWENESDMANIKEADSFEEIAFKMYEQIKSFNNRLSDLQKGQKEFKEDLKQLEG